MIRLVAPNGKKLRDIRTDRKHKEVVCKEGEARYFVVADSDEDPIKETLDGVTLEERVADLEDAVIELAEIITEEV